MSVCTFFGHRECHTLDGKILYNAIEKLINNGADKFYVGKEGQFDHMALDSLIKLKNEYPHISFSVVLAYMPKNKDEYNLYEGYSLYPEGLETVPPRFAVDRRNKWMIEHADSCLCYIDHTWGGAYKYAKVAKKKGLNVICLGSAEI